MVESASELPGGAQPGCWSVLPLAGALRLCPQDLNIVFLTPGGVEPGTRPALLLEALSALGSKVTLVDELRVFVPNELARFDAAIAFQAHGSPKLLESLAACSAAHVPVLLDLETDYEQMPVDHPDYERLGLSTPAIARAYAASLLLANRICVPSQELAADLKVIGYPAAILPDGWSRRNPLWQKEAAQRRILHIGWIGTPGQVQDVAEIRRMVVRVIREFPQTRLVIGGDPQVYRLFESLPESRRLFLPAVGAEDYPYLLSQVDILLVPRRNTPFNRTLSDRCLMEAGARGIPWVASPLPPFTSWGTGGLVANSADEWHTYLRQLVLDDGLRISLGQAGRHKAQEREMERIAEKWVEVIGEVVDWKDA